ncbi:MAG TPA: hypothetical protein DDZ42_12590 [Candidatus Rokubacteria bacterium]|nr:hypothetical protein [Candidatus Rokubacteria bacterium]
MAEKRVLVLDDEPATLSTFKKFFADFQHGVSYLVETASNGAEAARVLRRGRPDLILLDVQMKGLDGLALLKQVRAVDRTIPVIVVTGRQNGRSLSEALSAGIFAYAPKPCDFIQLEHLVGLVVSSRVAAPA